MAGGVRSRQMRRMLVLVALAVIIAGSSAPTAGATFPGETVRSPIARSIPRPAWATRSSGAIGRHAGHPTHRFTGLLLGLERRRQAHRVRLLRARRRSADRHHGGRRQRLARDHVRPGHPRGAVMVGERPPHRVRLLAGAVRPEQSRGLRDPRLDDARRRQQGQAAAHGRARIRRRAPICAERPLDRVRAPADHEQRRRGGDIHRSREGGRVHQLTPWGTFVEHPTWSPDSRWITFNSPDGTIEAIRPDGSERRTILQALEGFGGQSCGSRPTAAAYSSYARTGERCPSLRRTSTTTSASWTPTAPTSSTSPTPSRPSRMVELGTGATPASRR